MSTERPTTIRVTDLFAGAGGFTEGIVTADERFDSVQAVEWDIDAAATYRENFPSAEVINADITEWVQEGLLADCDVIIGGPPCQGFSTLGKQEENDEKNLLWRQYAHVVEQIQPQYFIMENVPQFEISQQKAVFVDELENGGLKNYRASFWTVNTADYGTPQARKRMIVLGSRRDLTPLLLPVPTHDPKSYETVRSAFAGLTPSVVDTDLPVRKVDAWGKNRPGAFRSDELHLTRNFSDLSLRRFEEIPPGGNRFDLPYDLQAPCWRKHKTGSGDVMGRLHIDKPSVTIRTEFNKPEKGRYLHPFENRAITHHEAARLMGFPDDYLWVGSKTSIARQIGNAVPIPLGVQLGLQIAKIIS